MPQLKLDMSPTKRQRSSSSGPGPSASKKLKTDSSGEANGASSTATQIYELPGKIATAKAAALVDAAPPLQVLKKYMEDVRDVDPGEAVCYWMRMEDMRSKALLLPIRPVL